MTNEKKLSPEAQIYKVKQEVKGWKIMIKTFNDLIEKEKKAEEPSERLIDSCEQLIVLQKDHVKSIEDIIGDCDE